MNLNMLTLVLMLALTFIIQVIAIYVQYRVNSGYRGIGWWVAGTALMALGFILMPMVTVKSLVMFARIANPMVELGLIFLYIGIARFLDSKENKWIIGSIYSLFVLAYYYYMYINNNIIARTVVISATVAAISLMTAYKLFFKRDSRILGSANFTATVFLCYGCFSLVRAFFTPMLPAIHSYHDPSPMYQLAYLIPIITGMLWTFGFIIMVNQRLNGENREEKEKWQLVFNASPDDITITDMEGGILSVSPAADAMFGYKRGEGIGSRLLDFIVPEDCARAQSIILRMCQGDYPGPNEYRGVRKDCSVFDIEVNSGIIRGTNGRPTKMVFIVRDITERKQAEQQIQALVQQLKVEKNTAQFNSMTDSLTGLANRRYLDEALSTEFYRLKRSGSPLSLIMLDVDHFKKFNDRYGHLAGDECLRQIGITLKILVGRAADIVARYGGEEFVVVLPETESEGAAALAERIRKAVEALAIPHAESDTAQYVTVSLGIATVYTTSLAAPEQVVVLADDAMYSAKQGGRNRIAVAAANAV